MASLRLHLLLFVSLAVLTAWHVKLQQRIAWHVDFHLPLDCKLIYPIQFVLHSVQVDIMEHLMILVKFAIQVVQAALYQVLIVLNVGRTITEKLVQMLAQIHVVPAIIRIQILYYAQYVQPDAKNVQWVMETLYAPPANSLLAFNIFTIQQIIHACQNVHPHIMHQRLILLVLNVQGTAKHVLTPQLVWLAFLEKFLDMEKQPAMMPVLMDNTIRLGHWNV